MKPKVQLPLRTWRSAAAPDCKGFGDPARQDELFSGELDINRVLLEMGAIEAWLNGRGWVLATGEFKRNGTPLLSEEGMAVDREAFARWNAIYLRYQLIDFHKVQGDDVIRPMRIAFEAGMAFAELKAYEALSKGRGPKPVRSKQFAELETAFAKWERAHPVEAKKRRPTANELKGLVMNFGPSGAKAFANRVSEWRADRSRK